MIRTLASLFFYTRFVSAFSRIGLQLRRKHWQADDLRLDGQRWLVTGASGGIGAAIVAGAGERGATVLAVARDADKLAQVAAQSAAPERVQAMCCDLASSHAVRALAQQIVAAAEPIDVLVNNVGVLLNEYQSTIDGLETSFATNLLNPYMMTEHLYACGALHARSTVINMSSGGMYGARLELDKLAISRAADFDGMAAYAQHKRAQVELCRYWNARWDAQPRAYVMHPGWVDTAGVQQSLPWFRAVLKSQLRTPDEGADTALWLAATRPQPTAAGGIWLDRVLDPEHQFGFTRSGADGTALAQTLDQTLERIGIRA